MICSQNILLQSFIHKWWYSSREVDDFGSNSTIFEGLSVLCAPNHEQDCFTHNQNQNQNQKQKQRQHTRCWIRLDIVITKFNIKKKKC